MILYLILTGSDRPWLTQIVLGAGGEYFSVWTERGEGRNTRVTLELTIMYILSLLFLLSCCSSGRGDWPELFWQFLTKYLFGFSTEGIVFSFSDDMSDIFGWYSCRSRAYTANHWRSLRNILIATLWDHFVRGFHTKNHPEKYEVAFKNYF